MAKPGFSIFPRINICLFLFLMQGCSPYKVFYYPNRVLYVDPDKMKIEYKMLEIPSLNEKKLFALLFETKDRPLGTVVHFHGNFGNVSNHFMQAQFLTNYGFDVLAFDYQGYGSSEGKPHPKHTIEDGLAVVRYAADNLRNKEGGVLVFGQSLGGAVGGVVAAQAPQVKGVVLEASFTSYRAIARHAMAKTALLWPLYPVYPWFIGKKYDLIKNIGKISPRPLLFVHGDQDRIVPLKMSRQLFAMAGERKELWIVPGAGHLECRREAGSAYQEKVAAFFEGALKIPIQ